MRSNGWQIILPKSKGKKQKDPNPKPICLGFGFLLFGAGGEIGAFPKIRQNSGFSRPNNHSLKQGEDHASGEAPILKRPGDNDHFRISSGHDNTSCCSLEAATGGAFFTVSFSGNSPTPRGGVLLFGKHKSGGTGREELRADIKLQFFPIFGNFDRIPTDRFLARGNFAIERALIER